MSAMHWCLCPHPLESEIALGWTPCMLLQDIDDSIQHALGVLKELMPHVNVQRQMSEEQQVWLTFASLVEGNRSGHTAQP